MGFTIRLRQIANKSAYKYVWKRKSRNVFLQNYSNLYKEINQEK